MGAERGQQPGTGGNRANFLLPTVQRPSKTATFSGAGDRLHTGLANMGGTRTRTRVQSGSTNRPSIRQQQNQGQGSSRAASATSSRASTSSVGSRASSFSSPSSSFTALQSASDAPTKPMTLARRQDRLKIRDTTTKITGKREGDIRQVFRTFDVNRDGTLNREELKNGLNRFNFGLSDIDIERLMLTLDKDGSNSVSYDEFIKVLNNYTPLGEYTQGKADNAILVAAPWEKLHVDGAQLEAWDKNLFPAPPYVSNNAKGNTPEQEAADNRTLHLVSNRFYQAASRIRNVFRKLDVDRDGVVDKREFITGVDKLGLSIPLEELERFFDIIEDGSGVIDYVQFLACFDGEEPAPRIPPPVRGVQAVVSQLDLEPEEVAEVMTSPQTSILRERLYSQSYPASQVFRRFDTNGDGYLGLQEFTQLCKTLSPGTTVRDAACLLADIDPTHDGYLSYEEFASHLANDRPPHPRSGSTLPPPPMDTTYRSMYGGTINRLGNSCIPHGPGKPPVNHPIVSQIFERTNRARTEAQVPALEGLWNSLESAAAAGVGGYAEGKPGARALQAARQSMGSSRPSTAPEGRSDGGRGEGHLRMERSDGGCLDSQRKPDETHLRSVGSARSRGTWAARSTFGYGPVLGPAPGAAGAQPTGMSLEPDWKDARSELARNSARYSPFKPTASVVKPQRGTAQAWNPKTHYDPRPGVGGKERSTTVQERAARERQRVQTNARYSVPHSKVSARKHADQTAAEARDTANVNSKSMQRRRFAERTYLYDKCGVAEGDRQSAVFFMRKN